MGLVCGSLAHGETGTSAKCELSARGSFDVAHCKWRGFSTLHARYHSNYSMYGDWNRCEMSNGSTYRLALPPNPFLRLHNPLHSCPRKPREEIWTQHIHVDEQLHALGMPSCSKLSNSLPKSRNPVWVSQGSCDVAVAYLFGFSHQPQLFFWQIFRRPFLFFSFIFVDFHLVSWGQVVPATRIHVWHGQTPAPFDLNCAQDIKENPPHTLLPSMYTFWSAAFSFVLSEKLTRDVTAEAPAWNYS